MRTVIYVEPDGVINISPQLHELFDGDNEDTTIGSNGKDKQIVQFGDALVESTADGVAFIFDGPVLRLPFMFSGNNVTVTRVRLISEGSYCATAGEYESTTGNTWMLVEDVNGMPRGHQKVTVWSDALHSARDMHYKLTLGDILEPVRPYKQRSNPEPQDASNPIS